MAVGKRNREPDKVICCREISTRHNLNSRDDNPRGCGRAIHLTLPVAIFGGLRWKLSWAQKWCDATWDTR